MRTNFMTAEAVVAEMRSNSLLNAARRIVAGAFADIEQGMAQRKPLTIIEARNIEFDAVIQMAALLGVELKPGQVADEVTRQDTDTGAAPSPTA